MVQIHRAAQDIQPFFDTDIIKAENRLTKDIEEITKRLIGYGENLMSGTQHLGKDIMNWPGLTYPR